MDKQRNSSGLSLSRLSHTARFKINSDKAMVELERRMDELKVALDARDDLQAKQDLLESLSATVGGGPAPTDLFPVPRGGSHHNIPLLGQANTSQPHAASQDLLLGHNTHHISSHGGPSTMGLPSNNHQQEGLVKSAVMSMMGGGGNSSLGSGAFHGSILKKLQQIAQRPGLDPQNPLPPTPGTNLPGSSTLLAKGLTTGLGTGLSTALGTEGGGGEAEAVAGGGAEGDPKSVNPSILTASQYAIPLDALPINLNGYLMEEETIGKLCHMVPGDAVLVFQNFMVRFHEIVSLSHLPLPKSTELSQDQVQAVLQQHQLTSLTNAVLRMTYFFIAMSTIRPNLQQALFKYNLMTGAEEEAPMGWYKDVALLIPVNRRVGLLIAAGATYLKRVAEGEKKKLQLDTTDVLAELRKLMQSFDSDKGSGGSSYHYSDPLLSGMDKTRLEEVMTLDNLLGKLSQYSDNMIAHRSQICAHITCLTLGLVDMEILSRVYVACWPYYIRGMIVMEHYIQRPDVQAVLPQNVLERMGWMVSSRQQPNEEQQQQQQQQPVTTSVNPPAAVGPAAVAPAPVPAFTGLNLANVPPPPPKLHNWQPTPPPPPLAKEQAAPPPPHLSPPLPSSLPHSPYNSNTLPTLNLNPSYARAPTSYPPSYYSMQQQGYHPVSNMEAFLAGQGQGQGQEQGQGQGLNFLGEMHRLQHQYQLQLHPQPQVQVQAQQQDLLLHQQQQQIRQLQIQIQQLQQQQVQQQMYRAGGGVGGGGIGAQDRFEPPLPLYSQPGGGGGSYPEQHQQAMGTLPTPHHLSTGAIRPLSGPAASINYSLFTQFNQMSNQQR